MQELNETILGNLLLVHWEYDDVVANFDICYFDDAASHYGKGYIKWDGCTELAINVHLCGLWHMRKHVELVQYLWNRAGELLCSREMGLWKVELV